MTTPRHRQPGGTESEEHGEQRSEDGIADEEARAHGGECRQEGTETEAAEHGGDVA